MNCTIWGNGKGSDVAKLYSSLNSLNFSTALTYDLEVLTEIDAETNFSTSHSR